MTLADADDAHALGFDVELVSDMVAVGAVQPRGVRLWARAPGATTLTLELRDPEASPPVVRAQIARPIDPIADHTVAFAVPDDTPGLDPLVPDRTYGFRVLRADGACVGEGRFRAAPERAVARYAFAVASCHQPFSPDGVVLDDAKRMLESVEAALDAHDVRFVLLVGDQIYADHPAERSLFGEHFRVVAPPGRASLLDCTRDEVRRLYQLRHRIWFGVEPFQRLQARFATYPMLDDHEIKDNFGTSPEHDERRFRTVRDGARDAFHDWQASRVLERDQTGGSFHYGFVHGPVGVFVMDLRSERRATDETVSVYGVGQLDALQRFLATNADLPVITVVITVPIVYVEAWLTGLILEVADNGTDVADRWTNPKALVDRDRLLRVLREHAKQHRSQRVILAGGDIHVGCLFRIDWSDGTPSMHQITSSAISNVQHPVAEFAAERVPHLVDHVFGRGDVDASVVLVEGQGRNPYGGLNVGVIEVELGEHTQLRFRLIGAPDEQGRARIVFDSGWV